ncbi:MAG: TetR/AcrR family transcriptional regulator [Reinekea forsetii]|jgi:AcrR family transcriptional regulator|uniref:TetR/AcrR family transcriptional regulator n=1 Tax=Reinekea sp. TaxID=1970455 RepID=UPI00257EF245|nr:TetR/AcrR family transcriptional regulator [Reinekea sp.]MDO7672903.1 TetR/AcrR family transcriptional regulator [Reinekea forsetii]|tara:strand:+ start:1038 stop:1646 length:609 start_codon:yes stop_codon:yes gene_type:complete
MATTPNNEQSDKRGDLLKAARELFLKNAYNNISIRKIAERANVNSALIAYYFGSKSGLFREMVRSYIVDILGRLQDNLTVPSESSLENLFLNLYRNIPSEFVQLIFRTMVLERGEMREWLLHNFVQQALDTVDQYFDQMIDVSDRDERTDVVRTIFQSMLVGPKLLLPTLQEIGAVTLDDNFYQDLARFNAKLLAQYFNLEK